MTNRNKNEREVCVLLPNKEQLDMTVGMKVRGQEVLSQLSELLGVKELHLFGLSILRDEEHLFLDLEQKLTKYFGKEWKGRSYKDPVCLYLRVQYYVEYSQLIPSSRVQYLYYADLKQRVLHSQCYHQEALFFQLAAYAMQAELGDFAAQGQQEGGGQTKGGERMGRGGEKGEIEGQEEERHYFHPQEYLPPWIVRRRGRDYLLLHTPLLHADLRGMSPSDAVLLFIKEASSLQTVPVTLYRMRQGKKERKGSVLLGLALKGVYIYQEVGGILHLLYDFSWSDIDRLTFQGCRFEIQAVGSLCVPKLVFYTTSTLHSKHILKHLSDSHRLNMNTRATATQLGQQEENQVSKLYREAYICDRVGLSLRLCSSSGEDSLTSEATSDRIPQRRVSMATTTSAADMWLWPTGQRSEESPWVPEIELCVDEPEEVSVDDPDEMMWLAELTEGVSVDGPLLMPVSRWADVTVEMKQVLKMRTPDGGSVD